ncbi:MAG: hypothetical protein GY943_28045 [Chloroflexi bacterium]|nr:hypothetical protein [Chloroflexota bacterium]
MQQPQIGGKAVTRLFIKGNDDLVNGLLSSVDGGARLEKGVKECVAEAYEGKFSLEVVRETAVSSDLLLQQINGVTFPEALRTQGLDDEFLTAQFESNLFDEDADIIALSILSDMLYPRWRHQGDGVLICPPLDWQQTWSSEQRDWFIQNFSPIGKIQADEYKENMTQLVELLKEKTSAHIVLVGASSFDPDDDTHNIHGKEDPLALRALRFSLVMMELSQDEGVTIIDVDRILAEMGCSEHVNHIFDYSDETYKAICAEFVRVITDVSFFEERPILVQMGQRKR